MAAAPNTHAITRTSFCPLLPGADPLEQDWESDRHTGGRPGSYLGVSHDGNGQLFAASLVLLSLFLSFLLYRKCHSFVCFLCDYSSLIRLLLLSSCCAVACWRACVRDCVARALPCLARWLAHTGWCSCWRTRPAQWALVFSSASGTC